MKTINDSPRLHQLLIKLMDELRKNPTVVINPDDDLVTVNDATRLAGVCERTVRNRINDGTIMKYKVGRTALIHKSDLQKLN